MRQILKELFAWMRCIRRLVPSDHVIHKFRLGSLRPQGFESSTKAWLARNTAIGVCREIWPPDTVTSKAPEGFGAWENSIQRDWTARTLPGVEGYIFNNSVRYWGYYGGVFINHRNQLLGDLSPDVWGLGLHYAFAASHLPKLTPIEGTVVVLTTPEAQGNYWHWTVELLPKIAFLEAIEVSKEEVTAFVVNISGARYERETLEEFLPRGSKIIPSTKRLHLSADRLITFSTAPHRHDFHPRAISWLHSMRPQCHVRKMRIYLTRGAAQKRRLGNEQELTSALGEFGFQLCDPSRMSVREQREVFSQAALVVGCHGAGLTNLVWCERGTAVVEIHAPAQPELFYWRVCEILGLSYDPVFGTQRKGRRASRSSDDDFLVNVEQIRSLVQAKVAGILNVSTDCPH